MGGWWKWVAVSVWMVGVSASVIFPCTIKSRRRFLLTAAHPDKPRKGVVKCLFVCLCVWALLRLLIVIRATCQACDCVQLYRWVFKKDTLVKMFIQQPSSRHYSFILSGLCWYGWWLSGITENWLWHGERDDRSHPIVGFWLPCLWYLAG